MGQLSLTRGASVVVAWEKVSAGEHEHWAAGGPGSACTVDMRRHVTGECGRDVDNEEGVPGFSPLFSNIFVSYHWSKGDRRQVEENE